MVSALEQVRIMLPESFSFITFGSHILTSAGYPRVELLAIVYVYLQL